MDTAPDFHDEVLLSLEDLVKADPHCVQCNNGLTCIPLNQVPDVAYKLLQKHANLESLVEHQQNCPLNLKLGIDNCSAEKFASLFLESKGPDDAGTCQFTDNAYSPLKRHFKDVCQKISEVNEIQGQPHVIAARVESIQHTMKSVDETLRDHEGQLSALDDTQRFQDISLKDMQASLANLEANLASYRHDLRQQLRDKNKKKADGIWTAQDKHTGLFSQTLEGIHSLSQGFMTLLDHTQDIGIIWTALRDMQESMESVKKSLEQISGDSSSEVSRSWAHAQLSLVEELLCSTHSFPITPSRVLDDGETAGLEDLLQCTTGVDGAASSSDNQRSLAAKLYHYSMTVICSVIPAVSIQLGILSTISQCWILHNKLSEAQLCTFILASVVVFLAFIGFFSAFRGSLLKTQEVMDRPLWYALHHGGLPSNDLLLRPVPFITLHELSKDPVPLGYITLKKMTTAAVAKIQEKKAFNGKWRAIMSTGKCHQWPLQKDQIIQTIYFSCSYMKREGEFIPGG
ncbi:hypothetical protein EDC04DRAFT_2604118 [Pisolithus marmoratus]|nr:hypothetical protein EDC04DRAFT_2604118 [Pisolithus marmoratus]